MNNTDVMNLKGAALKKKAAELEIPGRSSMNADELRAAIASHLLTPTGPAVVTETGAKKINAAVERNVQRPHIGRETIEVSTLDNTPETLRRVTSNVLGSASPMSNERRTDIYQKQNGSLRLTPKQSKRALKKNNKHESL